MPPKKKMVTGLIKLQIQAGAANPAPPVGPALGELIDLETRVSASQIAYRHGRTFAIVWRPGRYVHSDVPLVLSLVLREPLSSTRVKEVVNVARDAWMHHLELRSVDEVDDEVRGWLKKAWDGAA